MRTTLAICVSLWTLCGYSQPADPQRTAVAIEALSRLSPDQINANPKLQAALNKVIEATRGTSQFVELVRKFQLTNENAGLIEIALRNSTNATGTDALRLVLENRGLDLVRDLLWSTNGVAAAKLAQALSNIGERQLLPLLEPIVIDDKRDGLLRKHAVRALAKTQEGAVALLKLAKEDRLGSDIKLITSMELNNARWQNVKTEAAQLLPLPRGKNAQALPPIAELLKRSGNIKRGAEVFERADVGCINCHQMNGKGVDFGPKLSEIGTKLGKDAIYESIFDPSAGISFGYEAWQVEMKNGDEAFGLIVSETPEELAVKTQNGIVTRYPKTAVAKRQMMKTSIMPSGLAEALSLEDLVDLVEYLASLKKNPAQN